MWSKKSIHYYSISLLDCPIWIVIFSVYIYIQKVAVRLLFGELQQFLTSTMAVLSQPVSVFQMKNVLQILLLKHFA